MHILIYGADALGSLLATRLQQAGKEVSSLLAPALLHRLPQAIASVAMLFLA